jgi:hypothetical protein
MIKYHAHLVTRLTLGSVALSAALLFSGCQSGSSSTTTGVEVAKPELENPNALAACLPSGITMETKTTDKEGDSSETVKEALARLKATAKGGKLYDMNKREIQFYKPHSKGLEILREPEYKKLAKKGTVVLIADSTS